MLNKQLISNFNFKCGADRLTVLPPHYNAQTFRPPRVAVCVCVCVSPRAGFDSMCLLVGTPCSSHCATCRCAAFWAWAWPGQARFCGAAVSLYTARPTPVHQPSSPVRVQILTQQGLDCLAGSVPYTAIKSREQMVKVSVLALVFCLSIVLANLSLRFIPVSFNQARALRIPAHSSPECGAALSMAELRLHTAQCTWTR